MKAEWQVKTLGEVCEVVNGGTPKTGIDKYWGNEHLWITPAEMGKRASPYVNDTERKITSQGLKNSSARLVPPNSVILSSRAPIGHLVINTKPMATNQGCKGLVPNDGLTHKYLFYFLMANVDLLNDLGSGATFKELSSGKLKEFKIPLAPLSEQQRIVAILDQAFEGIAKAHVNAEQNLQNARALFESHLQSLFSQCGESWIDSTISEFINFIDYRGKTPVKTASGLRLITAKNVKMGYLQDEPKEYVAPDIYKSWMTRGIPQRGDVLFTTEAPLANVAQLNTEEKVVFAQRIIIMQADPNKVDSTFLKYLLLSSPIQSRIHEQATGATAQGIKASLLKKIKISFPNTILKQQEIVTQLDALVSKRHRLESIYQRKIVLLDELKKSLLQQAFAGELTSNFHQSVVIPFQPSLPKPMSSTDVHAGVLALSYQKHEENGSVINFAHVKAEKIAHMIEARLGIDLGRIPIKDAAGPNDYPHLKIVESRARKAGYFDFKQVDGAAYRMVKLSKFDDLANKTRAFLAEKMPKIDELLELMLPMDTQQAEIFCTVYAAWNNLLLDGQEPTDENIVFEARENWHPDKLKIPREKFFGAIDWMRNKKVFPHGTGKKVLAKK